MSVAPIRGGRLYAERDTMALGDYYLRHIDHMTTEELFGKGDIAAELAWRDAALAASEARVAELEVGIVHRGDDVIMPEHLYLEINASGAHWKARAEAAERSLAEARELADGWVAAAERLEAGSRDFDLPADPAFVLSRENRAGTFRGCAKDLRAAIDALLPKGEGATS